MYVLANHLLNQCEIIRHVDTDFRFITICFKYFIDFLIEIWITLQYTNIILLFTNW